MTSRLFRSTPVMVLAFVSACGGDARQESQPAESPAVEGVHGVAPLPVGGTPSVVTLTGAGLTPPLDSLVQLIEQRGLIFDPTALIARVGDTIVVTNDDPTSHNVHARLTDTDSTVFMGDTEPDTRVSFVVDHEGGYDITCDEHPGMRSFVYATTAPRAVFADRDGSFVISDVPEGSYTLSVWSVDPSKRREAQVDVTGPSTEVTLVPPGS